VSFQLHFAGWILITSALYGVLLNLPVYATDVGLGSAMGAPQLGVIRGFSKVGRPIPPSEGHYLDWGDGL